MSSKIHLNHDDFFIQLAVLLKACHTAGHGTVLLSQKRLIHESLPFESASEGKEIACNPLWDLNTPTPTSIIIRASNAVPPERRKAGEKRKISTVVQPEELEKFYSKYAEVCKKSMEGLRKRDRSKKKKEKKKVKKESDAA